MKSKLILTLIAAAVSLAVNAQEVYVPTSKGDIEQLTRAVVVGQKTSGKSLLAIYGAKLTTSMLIDGKHANTVLPKTSSVFYVFKPADIPIQAFKLIHLKEKKKKRELPYMRTGVYSGSKTDLNDIQLVTEEITNELYALRPIGDLKSGEYALAYIENGVPVQIYDIRIEENYPPYPSVSRDILMDEFYPAPAIDARDTEQTTAERSGTILRWYFDSDPRGARIFYRVISNCPNEVKNTNESYMTTTPLEETKALNIPGLTYENAADVVIEIKVTKRGFEEQVKRYNVRQALDQQEISGFFELVEKTR